MLRNGTSRESSRTEFVQELRQSLVAELYREYVEGEFGRMILFINCDRQDVAFDEGSLVAEGIG